MPVSSLWRLSKWTRVGRIIGAGRDILSGPPLSAKLINELEAGIFWLGPAAQGLKPQAVGAGISR